jgi:hypothetical protein
MNAFLLAIAFVSVLVCAPQARADQSPSRRIEDPSVATATPPGGWPLSPPAVHLLLAVASGVTLVDTGRATLRAALGPEASEAIGLDHRGYPSPCERAMAAAYNEKNARTLVAQLEAIEEEGRAQEIQWARSMVPHDGIRFRGGRVLTGDSAVHWILAHPSDFDPELAHRRALKFSARASLAKVLRSAVADARTTKRACRLGR